MTLVHLISAAHPTHVVRIYSLRLRNYLLTLTLAENMPPKNKKLKKDGNQRSMSSFLRPSTSQSLPENPQLCPETAEASMDVSDSENAHDSGSSFSSIFHFLIRGLLGYEKQYPMT